MQPFRILPPGFIVSSLEVSPIKSPHACLKRKPIPGTTPPLETKEPVPFSSTFEVRNTPLGSLRKKSCISSRANRKLWFQKSANRKHHRKPHSQPGRPPYHRPEERVQCRSNQRQTYRSRPCIHAGELFPKPRAVNPKLILPAYPFQQAFPQFPEIHTPQPVPHQRERVFLPCPFHKAHLSPHP